jgi:hypothetical protein
MTAETKRQATLLAVLLAVLAGVLWWNLVDQATPPPGGTAQPAQVPATGAGQATGSAPVEDVRLEALDAPPAEPATTGRNPFRFGGGRAAAASQPFEALPAYVDPPPAGGPGVTPGGQAGGGAIPLKFIGIVTEAAPGRKLAVLSDGRNPPFYGREGDIIEGRYRIVRIGVESIELAHVDGRGQQTLRLSGS